MKVDVIMPQMGESIAEGTVLRYLKKVGEKVTRDEDILEISTDKVDATVPSPTSGTLAEILVPEGQTVEVNAILARVETEAGAAAEPSAAKDAPAAQEAAPAPAPQAAAPRPAAAPAPMPAPAAAGGPSMDELTSARRAGRIPSKEEMLRVRSTPLVRKIAREHGVDLRMVPGSGHSGRVTRRDIMAFVESGGGGGVAVATAPAAVAAMPAIQFSAGEATRVEAMTQMRKKIAEHMVASRRISAHVHTVFEVDMSAVAGLRAKHKRSWEEREGVKLTYMPFILKAAIEALKAFPVVNSSVDGDNIVYHRNVNMGVAVALDWGLIVPVIKNADERNLLGLARATNDLAARARSRKLTPDEIAGSTFSVTNPGVFGGLYGTPIINQPNVAILGVGGIEKRPVVINDAIAIRSMVYMVLGFDHRIIDGAVADQFMAHIKQTLERGTFTDLG